MAEYSPKGTEQLQEKTVRSARIPLLRPKKKEWSWIEKIEWDITEHFEKILDYTVLKLKISPLYFVVVR